MSACRILIAGPVRGAYDALLKRLKAVNDKSGPFSALLCVGPFFRPEGDGAEGSTSEAEQFVRDSISGVRELPCEVCFMDASGARSSLNFAVPRMAQRRRRENGQRAYACNKMQPRRRGRSCDFGPSGVPALLSHIKDCVPFRVILVVQHAPCGPDGYDERSSWT